MPGEFDFIRSLRGRTPPHPAVLTGPGDDCAVLVPPPGKLVVTTDLLTEGIDFLLAETTPEAVGRKAMGVNLSDIAAMAATPYAAVVAVALPTNPPGMTTRELADRLDAGLREMADRFRVPIVGGDTNAWAAGLVVTVTVLGYADDPVSRSGARPGDAILVTGPLGGSLLGRHLLPVPRVREALAIAAVARPTAMIDVSDGFAADLSHILAESAAGAEIDADALPIHADAIERSRRTGRPALDHALFDGEDFELILTLPEADARRLLATPLPLVPVHRVGRVVADRGLWLIHDGRRTELPPGGWVHSV
jgi:thiamine-monophosphate kinase